MGTLNGEEMMNPIDLLIEESLKYKEVIREYCFLATQNRLTEDQADRMAEIFQQAQSEPLLSFLIDESDHLVAHQLGLIDEEFVKQQQAKLGQSIRQTRQKQWIKKVQTMLKNIGLYAGSIDGICGPKTQEAIASFKQLKWEGNSGGWSIC